MACGILPIENVFFFIKRGQIARLEGKLGCSKWLLCRVEQIRKLKIKCRQLYKHLLVKHVYYYSLWKNNAPIYVYLNYMINLRISELNLKIEFESYIEIHWLCGRSKNVSKKHKEHISMRNKVIFIYIRKLLLLILWWWSIQLFAGQREKHMRF